MPMKQSGVYYSFVSAFSCEFKEVRRGCLIFALFFFFSVEIVNAWIWNYSNSSWYLKEDLLYKTFDSINFQQSFSGDPQNEYEKYPWRSCRPVKDHLLHNVLRIVKGKKTGCAHPFWSFPGTIWLTAACVVCLKYKCTY